MFKSVKATTAIEYGLIAILLSAPVGVAFGLLGDQLYTDVGDNGMKITAATAQDVTDGKATAEGEFIIDDTGAIAQLTLDVYKAFRG